MTVRRQNAVVILMIALLLTLTACDGRPQPPVDTTAPAPKPPVVLIKQAPKPTAALPADASCITDACHARYSTATSKHVHGPVAQGECASCHEPDQGGHIYPQKRQGADTCTFCHAVSGTREHQHAALKDGCTTCHNPHAAQEKFLLPASVDRLCAKCHDIPLQKFAHEPFAAGQCTQCHEPHQADSKKLLRGGEGPDHCFTCHGDMKDKLAKSAHAHDPAKKDCLTCHNPHTSNFRFELAADIDKACLACHDKTAQHLASSAVAHGAVNTGLMCVNCHDAHAADRPALLAAREDQLCVKCHDKDLASPQGRTIPAISPAITNRKSLHGPVASGGCSGCHDPHGSSYSSLLDKKLAPGFYASFDLSNYDLCFDCHDKRLVLEPATTALTNFRDGDRNLHYLHVNREEKGRTCRTCHATHGSDMPKHLATAVPFEGSGWAMPIKYEAQEQGGSCSPGCHEPQQYDRTKPASAPPSTQPASAPASGGATS